MPAWSSDFKILRENYKEEFPDMLIRSNMDIGPAKIRKRTVATPYNISFSMMLTPEVYQQFKTFYLNNAGTVFDFTDPTTLTPLKARFAERPSVVSNETFWSVSCKLEIMP